MSDERAIQKPPKVEVPNASVPGVQKPGNKPDGRDAPPAGETRRARAPAVADINSFENLAARALADTPQRLAGRSHYPRRMGAGLAAPSLLAQYRQAPTLAA